MPIVPIDDTNRADSNRVLAHAFRDDPMIRWMMGPSTARDEKVFAFLSRFHRAPGASDLYVDDDGTPVGAAMWNPPGYTEKVNKWLVPLQALAVFRGGFRRSAVVESIFPKLHPKEPHWYLPAIGATIQGRGIGSALLEHRLSQVNGVPAYLESSHRDNIPLYERFGFAVVDEIKLPMDGPLIWPMLRPADA
ncbi:MAG TPA: GNAT family N-acetyltransferase [Gordonia sp. (in: high G+C Gram-positive bacteria)]|uniref:GNAT family N-acetyltransferase n=1 Tax=unclassified Gordonia (in: high G+C Gram-positive bacteria) TaxID=2657482 RepID=UPI000F94AFB1|nr:MULTISPECIES: GNAT family N-acetyltransferase [unclassified Gordonia (in: high G+C Gram-positive bacteria)]RTL03815.1 MAG: N-acetyltransferase [Acidimicrobiia bacterium]HNP55712.1 GNAT family N-acetyltransferase [Gordonia sp. (in: high G+C Gram-positive bacteria)]HRC49448.1 GNAT family N-acetyltransferase [Gordonia sp. (in: high G+C Gram-positive bacteria)]